MKIKLKSFALLNVCFAFLLTGCSQTPVKMAAIEKNTFDVPHEAPLSTELTAEDEYQFALDLARMYVSKKHFTKAENLLHKLRKSQADDIRVYRLLADVYEQTDRLELSLTAWQQVNKQAEKSIEDSAQYARLAIMLEKYELAKPIYEAWLNGSATTQHAIALNNLGFVALLEGNTEQAKSYLKQALEKDPLNSKAQHNLQLVVQMQPEPASLSPKSSSNSL